MATSGSVDFTVTAAEVMQDAAEFIGVLDIGGTLPADHQKTILRSFNMLLKQWNVSDFSAGEKMWLRRRATIFLQKDTHVYSLGSTGDNATESYVETTLSAQASASATALTVSSITSISSANYIGVVMDTGKIHWTTVNGAPSGSTVNITAGMEAVAASGNRVYVYATKMRRPIELLTAVLRNTSDEDTPISFIDLAEYEQISNKGQDGTPSKIYFEGHHTNAKIYLNVDPDDTTKQIEAVYRSPCEDIDASSNNIDMPQEWYRALYMSLARDIAPKFGRVLTMDMKELIAESLTIAQSLYPENSTAYFQPDA